LIRPLENL